MGWLIALGVLLLIGSVPLGVLFRYDSQGPLVKIVAGFLRVTVFPVPKWLKRSKKKTPVKAEAVQPEKTETAAPEKPASQPSQSAQTEGEKKGGSLRDFLPLVQLLLDFMNQFRKKLRINRLQLKLILAGDDPCDLALGYGRAWAALGNLMPILDKIFVIGKRDCEVECDFTADEPLVTAQMELTIRLGQLISLGAVYGFRLLKELQIFKKKRKGGAVS